MTIPYALDTCTFLNSSKFSHFFEGNAGDSLSYHNGMKFSTYDRDNDQSSRGNCPSYHKGAWWYKYCYRSNLNGRYLKAGDTSDKGIAWKYWKNNNRSLKKAEMKIRPTQF